MAQMASCGGHLAIMSTGHVGSIGDSGTGGFYAAQVQSRARVQESWQDRGGREHDRRGRIK